ncbi:MAG: PAS domain S-box protein [Bacteroidetes bacterium]|nr:PAS domain S-box protein [Bacteroidota bacterium]
MAKRGDDRYNLEFFFELSPDLLCIAGFDGYFKKINPAVSKTLGYTEEELFSRPINSFVHPDDQHATEYRRNLIRKGTPLLNFENRYLTKTGEIVWLTWTSMPVNSKKLVFAIAKNVTHRKRLEEYQRLLQFLGHAKNEEGVKPELRTFILDNQDNLEDVSGEAFSPGDQVWLSDFERIVRKYAGKSRLSLPTLSSELFMSERQLHRRINAILGVTPNKFIRVIRMQIARELLADGKNHTPAEIAKAAGFETTAYFKKLFGQTYGSQRPED